MRIIRPVTVKVVVTNTLKERLGYELRTALQKVDAQLERLSHSTSVDGQAVAESTRTRDELLRRVKAVAELEIGSQQFHSTVDSLLEVVEGDVWPDLSAGEIILLDGKVVAMR